MRVATLRVMFHATAGVQPAVMPSKNNTGHFL